MFITFCQAVHVMLNEGRHVSKVDGEGQVKVPEKKTKLYASASSSSSYICMYSQLTYSNGAYKHLD